MSSERMNRAIWDISTELKCEQPSIEGRYGCYGDRYYHELLQLAIDKLAILRENTVVYLVDYEEPDEGNMILVVTSTQTNPRNPTGLIITIDQQDQNSTDIRLHHGGSVRGLAQVLTASYEPIQAPISYQTAEYLTQTLLHSSKRLDNQPSLG